MAQKKKKKKKKELLIKQLIRAALITHWKWHIDIPSTFSCDEEWLNA